MLENVANNIRNYYTDNVDYPNDIAIKRSVNVTNNIGKYHTNNLEYRNIIAFDSAKNIYNHIVIIILIMSSIIALITEKQSYYDTSNKHTHNFASNLC